MNKKILITGGAGFIGSNLAILHKQNHPDDEIIVLDNLKRKGSELSLPRLKRSGITYIKGDVRYEKDLAKVGDIDLILECSAEPSVKAGYDNGARYLVDTNLVGTINCLEYARKNYAEMIFLSTSRVYPIIPLRELPLEEKGKRLIIPDHAKGPGWSNKGINTDFTLNGTRSLYGATKFCSEILIQEYAAMYDLNFIINRCSVISGPWQMGKVDQGFMALWIARHYFGKDLAYTGFGGKGYQVRDVLHVEDLYELIALQLENMDIHRGKVFNVGGGKEQSVSLRELTELCKQVTGNTIKIRSKPDTHPSDIPYYINDNEDVMKQTGWKPKKTIQDIVHDVLKWIDDHHLALKDIFT